MDKKARTRHRESAGIGGTHILDRSITREYSSAYDAYTDLSEYTVNVRGVIVADFMPSRIILNPVTTAWELTTLSFVLDWFLNVGQALNALSFLALNDRYTASQGFSVTGRRTGSRTTTWKPTYSGTTVQEVEQNWEVLSRKPCYISKIPLPKVRLDGAKVVDLIALAWQAVGKLIRR
jgi:hypothetical protein